MARRYRSRSANRSALFSRGGEIDLKVYSPARSIVDAFRVASHGRGWLAYAVTLLAAWIFGLFNAFMHARDAWAAMPGGLILSLVATALVIAATGMAFCRWRAGARP